MIETIFTSICVAVLTSVASFLVQERKLRADLRTEFMAERAIAELLGCQQWEKRSFDEIRKRIGGFDDEELRKLLVRAGAVRFEGENSKELWGLIQRNKSIV